MTTRDQRPDEPNPDDEQTLAERVMHGEDLQDAGPDPDTEEPDTREPDTHDEPGVTDEAGAEETRVIPADPADPDGADGGVEVGAEETRVIPAAGASDPDGVDGPDGVDEVGAEATQVLPEQDSVAEETRVIPAADDEEPGTERTAVLPPQDVDPGPRTDQALDDPRSEPQPVASAAAAPVAESAATPTDAPASDRAPDAKPAKPPRTTDRPLGALALFVLRVVTGVIFGVHGVQKLLDIPGTREFFGSFPLPQAELFGLVTAVGELCVGLGLVLGLAVRIAGLGAMAIAIGALVLVQWTAWPIAGSPPGFSGELELLLAAVGFVFVMLGGGRIGLDRMFRKNP